MRLQGWRNRAACAIAAVVAVAAIQAQQGDRDAWQKPAEVIAALELKPGEVVADIGAGSGYFTFPLAKAVGPTGRVHAVEVDTKLVERLAESARSGGAANVTPVLARPHDPGLPPGSVDRFFLSNVWHHIDDQASYLAAMKRALKPGGQIVMIDFHKRDLPVGPPVQRKIAREDLIERMAAAGVSVAAEHTFLPYQYFIVFTPGA
jgi:ubiquinone/menaquinone biosynthesis C-methylase UbiE